MKYPIPVITLCLLVLHACSTPREQATIALPSGVSAEIIAFGPYPNDDYNYANEMNNGGMSAEAILGYERCIASCKNQAIVEDAMYNVSQLYFETGQETNAYRWMDSLIQRKYRWLEWYTNANHTFVQTLPYQDRLRQIKGIYEAKKDPANCVFHYEDVDRFLRAFAKAKQDWSLGPEVFYTAYFAQASSPLYFYQRFKIQSSSYLFAKRVEQKEAYFNSIAANLQTLAQQEPTLRSYLTKFEAIYPEAIFPDVYFVVGCFNAGGTSSPFGLIIGAEMHAKQENSPLTNFNAWEQKVVRNAENLPLITLHELVHIQQNNTYENLLGNAIYEGAADFVSALICGSHINTYVHEWANAREAQIWEAFSQEMYGDNVSNWIGNANNAVDKPADLGYYVGYKICESYYQQQPDKKQAIKDILTITDWKAFYLASGYMQ